MPMAVHSNDFSRSVIQIELIGCTRAGKSTLARQVAQVCGREGIKVILADDFVLQQLRLDWIASPRLRKLLVNLAGLSASVVTWRKNGELGLFATRVLFQLQISPLERAALLRNVLKKVGIVQIVRARVAGRTTGRVAGEQIIVMDEGLLQIAHNLFVHVSATPPPEAFASFVRLVRVPDVVVYVRPEETVLIERAMQGGHRRTARLSEEKVVRFIRRAVTTFDRLAQEPVVARKLLVVDGAHRITNGARDRDEPLLALASGLIEKVSQQNVA